MQDRDNFYQHLFPTDRFDYGLYGVGHNGLRLGTFEKSDSPIVGKFPMMVFP